MSFLVSPVRNITEKEKKEIEERVKLMEQHGIKVYWPKRDTDQNDPVGLRICVDNAKAILNQRGTLVWWNRKSQGSLFDFGMAFMLQFISEMLMQKKINMKGLKKLLRNRLLILENLEKVKRTPRKSFNNVLLEIDKLGDYL